MRVPNSVYGGIMGVGVLGLGLLTFAQSGAAAEATTSAEGLVIGEPYFQQLLCLYLAKFRVVAARSTRATRSELRR